jgi:hypothetical protein
VIPFTNDLSQITVDAGQRLVVVALIGRDAKENVRHFVTKVKRLDGK